MAKVKMDLTELRELEKKIEDLTKAKKHLEDTQQQVVVHHKYFKGKLEIVKESTLRDMLRYRQVSYGRYGTSIDGGPMYTVDTLISKGVIRWNVEENSTKNTKDYKNLSEIQDELRVELQKEVQERLNEALARATEAEITSSSIKDTLTKSFDGTIKARENNKKKLIKDHVKEIEDLIETHTEKVKEWHDKFDSLNEEFDDFKNDRKRTTLEEQIEELRQQLETERSKKWYQKF